MQNGHTLKDSYPDPVVHSTDTTESSQNYGPEINVPNGVNDLVEPSHETSSVPEEPTIPTSYGESIKSNLPPNTLPLQDFALHPVIVADDNNFDSIPSILQPPTSDLREEKGLINIKPSSELEAHGQQQELEQDSLPINGVAHETNKQSMSAPQPEPESINHFVSNEQDMNRSLTVVTPPSISTTELPYHPPTAMSQDAEMDAPIDTATSPAIPESTFSAIDHPMQDVPRSPGKIARDREDEDDGMEDGPAAKRFRTDKDASSAPEFKVPELPSIETNVNGAHLDERKLDSSLSITKPQQKFLLKGIQTMKRMKEAHSFLRPVDIEALNIPNYPSIITKPMDLRTLEEKLKEGIYPSVDAYVADFNQIIQNSVTFNGAEHLVTMAGYVVKATFDKQMKNLPGPDIVEPTPAERKSKKAFAHTSVKPVPSRRESRSSLPASARSPITAGSPQTFALGPQGVPLIRRDSTVGDGRPKREIHPPPPRDLPYANQKPKKKKYQWELKFCQVVINELKKPKFQVIGHPFMQAVDPVALNIPHYHKVIKKPMDLGTISIKLNQGEYESAKEFEADVRLMFQNCYKFNPASDPIHGMGKQFETVFDDQWAEKRQWVEDHAPGSAGQTPGSSPEPDYEEDEEDEEEEVEEEQNQLTKLQEQIAAMSRQVEMIQKKKSSPPALNKKATKGGKPVKKETKKSVPAAPVKHEKKAPSRPAKKEKLTYVTYEQKQDISNRINSLPESRMSTALKIIRDNMPNLKVFHSTGN